MRQKVTEIFEQTLTAMQSQGILPEGELPKFMVAIPKQQSHGDFAVNAAMVLKKLVGKNPRELAQSIIDHLQDPTGMLASTEIAGPGFINVKLAPALWQSVILQIEEAGDRYGHTPGGDKGSVNLEFVSANPTGPLHVGHGRGAVVGDALARLLVAAGYRVTREYYINDHGNQVDVLARSLHLRYQELLGRQIEFPQDAYPAEYVKDIARQLVEEFGEQWLDRPQKEWIELFQSRGIEANLSSIREDLKQLSVEFDLWSRESELHSSGAVTQLVADLEARGATYVAQSSQAPTDKKRRGKSKAAQHSGQQKGGTFAQLSAHGDEDDRIILRHDGSPVYLTADLAYHRTKLQRGDDVCIDVFGADHTAHTHTLRAGLTALGHDASKLQFVLTQIVRLLRAGKEVRISKRAGNIELLSDLVRAVGNDATRFFFLMRAPSAQFDFDLDVATSQSLDNPVFYVQYGHARTCSLFNKAKERGIAYGGFAAATMERLQLPEELSLLRKMSNLADVVSDAAQSREPHRLVYYIEDLIREFHSYFTRYKKTERIISDDELLTQARLGLVNALRQVLRNALELLGVSAPDYMEPIVQEAEAAEGTP